MALDPNDPAYRAKKVLFDARMERRRAERASTPLSGVGLVVSSNG